MEAAGYLILVLHTHQPFVRHPELEYSLEENWLFEAIVESYIPLIGVFEGLIRDGIDFRITLSLTPTLLAMLADGFIQDRCVRYIEERIDLATRETERVKYSPRLNELARSYLAGFLNCRRVLADRWNKNLVSAFKYLMASEKVEIIASGATHAYFPLWEIYPKTIDLQVEIGVSHYEALFGKRPAGFWLPECGFVEAAAHSLRKAGIVYSFLDAHGILNGQPRPIYGVHAPIHCPPGLALFGRDWESHNLVWLKDRGYPGDPAYKDFNRDIGYDLDLDYLTPFTHSRVRIPTGIRYFRMGNGGQEIYDTEAAISSSEAHADHFVRACQERVKALGPVLGKPPALVALCDTEHFGHWWHEGPKWLDLVIRKMATDQKTVRLATALDYIGSHEANQVVMPSMSSWGYQGYSETWLMGRNHWIYPTVYKMIEILDELMAIGKRDSWAGWKQALNQFIRELLLAQSSDWAFMMHAETALQYAEHRVLSHIRGMSTITDLCLRRKPEESELGELSKRNNIFAGLDLHDLYAAVRRADAT